MITLGDCKRETCDVVSIRFTGLNYFELVGIEDKGTRRQIVFSDWLQHELVPGHTYTAGVK